MESDDNMEMTPSKKALTASYAISLLIAKHCKPFTEGEFIKECLMEAVKSFGNSMTRSDVQSIRLGEETGTSGITLSEANSIPLSEETVTSKITLSEPNNAPLSEETVTSRITRIASSTEEKLKHLLAACPYFSLCLDVSTDNRHVNQLSIFARIVQNDFSCVEELLDLVPLPNMTGLDIFSAVEQTLKKLNTDFSKCSAIITDVAKPMIDSKTGFCRLLKQRDLKFPVIHCIIRQEALCGKAVKLCTAMQIVAKTINVIKDDNRFLNHRKFQSFLEEHEAIYKDISLYCEVRWLSAGKCLENFFAIRKEIFLFLQEMPSAKCDDFKCFFEDLDFLSELALITDLTSHLNNLNLKLQQVNQAISQLGNHVSSFREKLILFRYQLERDILYFFPSCQILFTEHGKDCDFKKHLHLINSLITQFDMRLNDYETLEKDLIFFENPFTVLIEKQNLEFQIELCNLQNDLFLKTQYKREQKIIELYKILDASNYPRLINFGLRIFSMFGSTQLCEHSFSKLKYTKTDKCSCLSDASLSSLMRTTSSNIPFLVNSCKRLKKSN